MKRFNISKIACSIGALATCFVLFSTNFSVYAKTKDEMVAEILEKSSEKIDLSSIGDKAPKLTAEQINERVKKYTEAAKNDKDDNPNGWGEVVDALAKESPITWKQKDPRWGAKFTLPGGNNIYESGCKTLSSSILLKLSGTGGDGFNPITWCEFLKDGSVDRIVAGGTVNGNTTAWNNDGIVNEKNIFQWNGDFQPIAFVYASNYSSYETFLQSMRDAMDVGLYVSPRVNTSCGHYTAGLGYEGDEIILIDPGFDYDVNPIYLSEATAFNKIDFYLVYICENPFKPVKSRDSVALKKGETGSADNVTDLVDETHDSPANFNYIGITEWLDEYDIIEKHQLYEDNIEFLSREKCTLKDIAEVDSWKGNLQLQKEDGVYKYIRASFMFVGILITIYSVLLFIAFQFDRVNNFIEVNLLCILTFGKLQRAPDENSSTFTPDNPRTRLVTLKDIAGVTIAGVAIGVLLISGKVFSIIQFLMDKIDGIFN